MKAIQKQTVVWGGVFLVVGLMFSSAQAVVTLFDDQFSGPQFDTTNLWDVRTNFTLARAEFRSASPVVSSGFARMQFDTYNPNNPGVTMLGAEIMTQQKFSPGTHGISAEARVRVPGPIPGGIVAAFFGFEHDSGNFDEIDFEMLTNDLVNNNDRVLTNTWKDASSGNEQFVTKPSLDLADWNTLKFNWFSDRIEFFLNGMLLRTTMIDVSDTAMNLRFNFWAPNSNFASAYDPTLQPVSNPADNETYFFDVDYMTVVDLTPMTIPEPLTATLGMMAAGALGLAIRRRRSAFV